jgi:16S rRNA U1498 N3-methylase RsmE
MAVVDLITLVILIELGVQVIVIVACKHVGVRDFLSLTRWETVVPETRHESIDARIVEV